MMKTASKPTDSAGLMKKIFASLGIALAATLSLTNCTKELESPVAPVSEGIPFEVSTILTKTTNEGKSTKWAKDDAMNIFHADVDGTTYTSDGEFTVDEALTGIFSGTLATSYDATKAHDWYAFYPYSSYNKTPAGVDKDTFGYTTIGGTTQTQTGNNSTAHLSSTACPLYGIAKNVAAGKTPSFVMNNLTSVICVEVTNARDADLTVNSIEFTSTEDIVGTYYIDFTASPVKYTASGATYVSNTASLVVSNGEAIANGSSAKFYIAIKPHDVAANSTLKLSVNGIEKTIKPTAAVSFTAGKIKTLKYSYATAVADYVTLPWSIDGTGGSSVWSSTPGLSQSGLGNDYNSDSHSPYLTKMDTDGDYVQVKYDSPAKAVSFGVKKIGGDGESTMTLSGSSDGTAFTEIEAFTISGNQNDIKSFTSSKAISSDYRYVRLTFTKKANIGLGSVSITKPDPIEANDISGISARGLSEEELTFSITNPVEGTSISATCDGTVVTEVEADSGTILYSVAENTTGEAREGKITLTYGSVTKEVKVSQNADTFESTVTEIVLDATSGSQKTFTVTSDFDWTTSYTGSGFTVSPPKYAWAEGGKQTVTVTATADNAESGTIGLGTLQFTNDKTGKTLKVAIKQRSTSTTVTKTISEIVTANNYTVSSGNNINTIQKSIALDSEITISTTAGGNSGSFWATDTIIDWRNYQNGATDAVIKVSAADEHVIKKLTLTFTTSNNGTLKNGTASITSGTEYEINAQSVSYTIGCSKSGKSNGQIRITGISVTYE